MSTFLCKNGVRKEYFLTPTFIIEPLFMELLRGKEAKGMEESAIHGIINCNFMSSEGPLRAPS